MHDNIDLFGNHFNAKVPRLDEIQLLYSFVGNQFNNIQSQFKNAFFLKVCILV